MYLIDTNVISEARKGPKANPGVTGFFASVESTHVFLTVQTIGEIRRGLEILRRRGDQPQARLLEDWLNGLIEEHASRILAFDLDCAQIWGSLLARHPQHIIDKQIAAIALSHGLTVVTRNVDDFQGLGVMVHNPFQ